MSVEILQENPPNTWLKMTLKEGRKRQIRRVFELLNHRVLRLVRIAVGEIELGDLPAGHWRNLTEEEQVFLNKK